MLVNKIPSVLLNRHADRRLATGHPWVYSNELHESVDLKRMEPGSLVEVLNRHGDYVGTGFVNPRSLIAVRFLARQREKSIDQDFFVEKLDYALRLRDSFYGRDSDACATYRAVFGESDGLPGLVIDRYQDVWVIELHSLGMERRLDLIQSALLKVVGSELAAIVVRTDTRGASLEGLDVRREVIEGRLPLQVFAFDGGVRIPVDVLGGQKTGFFFDQRENRTSFARAVGTVSRARVLDVYCHLGAWGLRALKMGAEHVTFIDQDQKALDQVKAVAGDNGWAHKCSFLCGEALGALQSLEKSSFQAIALDPPSFISSRKNLHQGLKAYYNNNFEVARLLSRGAYLSTSSCSFHCDELSFSRVVAAALLDKGRVAQVVERGRAAWDHPVLAQMEESAYLKNLLIRA